MKTKLLPLIVIVAAFLIAAIMSAFKPNSLELDSPDREVAVTTEIINQSNVELQVRSQGTVKPRTSTTLVSEVSGAVLEVASQFEVGGTFKKGDILIRLDAADYKVAKQRAEAQLKSAKAQLLTEQARSIQAKKEWEMTGRPLKDAPILALRTPFLAEAEARLLQAQAEVAQAELKIQRTVIRAPYAGMVSATHVDMGQYVTIGTRLGSIFAIDYAEIRLPMTDKQMSKLSLAKSAIKNQPFTEAKVELKAMVNGQQVSWPAVLVRSEGTIEQSSRAQYLVAQIDDPYHLNNQQNSQPLLMGTFVEATVTGKIIKDVYALPRYALRSNQRIATVTAEKRLKMITVDYSYEDRNYYYLTSGLEGQVEVVTSGMGIMVDGMKVKPQSSDDWTEL
ncbi:MAG: efflux RND transporter periplasmic adaptor subunit [Porticoccaceae bacterium]